MKIAIVGAGRVGTAVGSKWAKAGHDITFGVRDLHSEKVAQALAACGSRARAVPVEACAGEADVVFLATPWLETESVIAQLGDLTGKVLIDATNPIVIGADEQSRGLLLGHTTSAGEEVAKCAPGARVVKAFNTTGTGNMLHPEYGDRRAITFVAGDDVDARSTTATLAREVGLQPIDVGGLQMARLLEPVGLLWIKMAYGEGWGPDFTFDVIKREQPKGQ